MEEDDYFLRVAQEYGGRLESLSHHYSNDNSSLLRIVCTTWFGKGWVSVAEFGSGLEIFLW